MNQRRAIILGHIGGWHERQLTTSLTNANFDVRCLPISKIYSKISTKGQQSFQVLSPEGTEELKKDDIIFVRAIPGGTLEEVIYRMDMLHAVEEWGCTVINNPEALERTVNKFHATAMFANAGIPTPETIVTEKFEDAMTAFDELGQDIVLKPIFGSEGKGLIRITEKDIAYRTFRVLELTKSVYYLQKYMPSQGWDIRAFVLNGKILGCIKRNSIGWKTNVSQGAKPENYPLTEEIETLALKTAKLFNTFYCGVDLYPTEEGLKIIEINGIPGWSGFQRATGIKVGDELAKWALTQL